MLCFIQNESDLPLVPPTSTEIGFMGNASLQYLKQIPECVKTVYLYNVSEIPAGIFPNHITSISILAGVTAGAVRAIPSHITKVEIGAGVTAEAVRAIPAHITEVKILAGATYYAIDAIPDTVHCIAINRNAEQNIIDLLRAKESRHMAAYGLLTFHNRVYYMPGSEEDPEVDVVGIESGR
jgi:predicted CoA-binding protein